MGFFEKMFGRPSILELRDKGNVKALIKMLDSDESTSWGDPIQIQVLEALQDLRDPRAVEPILELLKDNTHEKVRLSAIVALSEIGDPRAADMFLACIDDTNLSVRSWAVQGFSRITDVRAVPPLINALKDRKNERILGEIQKALTNQGEPAVAPLLAAVDHVEKEVRRSAIQALGKMRIPSAAEALITVLDHEFEDPLDAAFVAGSLGETGYPGAANPLIKAIKMERLKGLDYIASDALVKLGAAIVPELISLLQGEDRSVRAIAARALGKIGDSRGLDALRQLNKEETSDDVREAAQSASDEIMEANASYLLFKAHCPWCGSALGETKLPNLLGSLTKVCDNCKHQVSLMYEPSRKKLVVRMKTLPQGAREPAEIEYEPYSFET